MYGTGPALENIGICLGRPDLHKEAKCSRMKEEETNRAQMSRRLDGGTHTGCSV